MNGRIYKSDAACAHVADQRTKTFTYSEYIRAYILRSQNDEIYIVPFIMFDQINSDKRR